MNNLKIWVYNRLMDYYMKRWRDVSGRALKCMNASDHEGFDKYLERGEHYIDKLQDINNEIREIKSMKTWLNN